MECDVIVQHGRHKALSDVMNEAIVWSPKHHCNYERVLRTVRGGEIWDNDMPTDTMGVES